MEEEERPCMHLAVFPGPLGPMFALCGPDRELLPDQVKVDVTAIDGGRTIAIVKFELYGEIIQMNMEEQK